MKYTIYYTLSKDKEGLFTPHHKKYDVRVIRDGKLLWNGPYQCTYGLPKVKDVMECVMSDAYAAEYDLAEFLCEFAYNDDPMGIRKGIKAYEACKATREQLIANYGECFQDLMDEVEVEAEKEEAEKAVEKQMEEERKAKEEEEEEEEEEA